MRRAAGAAGEELVLQEHKLSEGVSRAAASRCAACGGRSSSTSPRAHREVAAVTFVEECDFTDVDAQADRPVRRSRRPPRSLQEFPELNARLEGDEIVYLDRYDIGVAVQTDQGLLVPVVRGCDSASIDELAAEVERLAEAARAGTLTPQELRGSTFTVTSAGKLGGIFVTPLVNHPEVAILGIDRIGPRPVVRDGEIVVRPTRQRLGHVRPSRRRRGAGGGVHAGRDRAPRVRPLLRKSFPPLLVAVALVGVAAVRGPRRPGTSTSACSRRRARPASPRESRRPRHRQGPRRLRSPDRGPGHVVGVQLTRDGPSCGQHGWCAATCAGAASPPSGRATSEIAAVDARLPEVDVATASTFPSSPEYVIEYSSVVPSSRAVP